MKNFKQYIFQELHKLYSKSELDYLEKLILEEITKMPFSQFFLQNKILTEKEKEKSIKIINRLKQNIPIQYVLNKAYFYNLSFYVDSNVLIPRPETEELVEWIIEEYKNKEIPINILDIGTGSGCISICLAKSISNSNVYAIEKFSKALDIAKKNAQLNNTTINFICADILSEVKLKEKFDVIVSNPPYIPIIEKQQMDNKVINNEPNTALFVPNSNPIIFYEKIADFAKFHLKENGKLFFEIHQNFGKEVKEILDKKGFSNIELKKDISNNNRMISATMTSFFYQ